MEAEDKMYEAEFMANLETPEQVREKMAQRLQELKQRREEERQDEVSRRMEQRFRDSESSALTVFRHRRLEEGRVQVRHFALLIREREAVVGQAKAHAAVDHGGTGVRAAVEAGPHEKGGKRESRGRREEEGRV